MALSSLRKLLRRLAGRPASRPHVSKLPFARRGANVTLPNSCSVGFPQRIALGSDLYFGPGCYFDGEGGITFEENVAVGPGVRFQSSSHRWGEGATAIPFDDVNECDPIVVRSHVWIGGWATILPGVELGEGCIVGAGAVVTKSVPPLVVVGGNPAREIGRRDAAQFERLKAEGRFHVRQRADAVAHDLPS